MRIEQQFNLIAKEYDENRKRFIPCYEILDYSDQLPEETFDVIISALSIHHLEDKKKEELFASIYNKLPEGDIKLWKERRKLDRECSVEEEIAMLRKYNFSDVKCVYSYQKFSVIVAVK